MIRHIRAVPVTETLIALLLLVTVAAVTLGVGSGQVVDVFDAATGVVPTATWDTFLAIFLRNTSVALGLFSGVLTLGLSTMVFLLLVGAMLGWSVAASVGALGVMETLLRSWSYTPLEVLGLALAGGAGLLPLVRLIRNAFSAEADRSPVLPRALFTLAVALGVLLIAALVETLAIAHTGLRALP